MGLTLTWLSIIVLIPRAGMFLKPFELRFDQFWAIVTSRRTLHALKLSFGLAFLAAIVNLVMGMIIVWALVRYRFPGRRLFDAIVDFPFALPTAVAGLTFADLFVQNENKTGWLAYFWNPIGDVILHRFNSLVHIWDRLVHYISFTGL